MSSYSFSTLFNETNSSWLTFESIKALEIKTSSVFNLVFADNTILTCFFLFSLVIDLYVLILPVIIDFYCCCGTCNTYMNNN